MTTREDLDFVSWMDADIAAAVARGEICECCNSTVCGYSEPDDTEPDYI